MISSGSSSSSSSSSNSSSSSSSSSSRRRVKDRRIRVDGEYLGRGGGRTRGARNIPDYFRVSIGLFAWNTPV